MRSCATAPVVQAVPTSRRAGPVLTARTYENSSAAARRVVATTGTGRTSSSRGGFASCWPSTSRRGVAPVGQAHQSPVIPPAAGDSSSSGSETTSSTTRPRCETTSGRTGRRSRTRCGCSCSVSRARTRRRDVSKVVPCKSQGYIRLRFFGAITRRDRPRGFVDRPRNENFVAVDFSRSW